MTKMTNPDEIEMSLNLVLHIIEIFGWFFIASWTIVRVGLFKKRTFSLLVFIYFTQGVTSVSNLIISEFSMSCSFVSDSLAGILMIVGFFCLSSRYLILKTKFHEKNNLF